MSRQAWYTVRPSLQKICFSRWAKISEKVFVLREYDPVMKSQLSGKMGDFEYSAKCSLSF